MGILRGLISLGVTAGAAFAAAKVAQKYGENKDLDAQAAAEGEMPEEVPSGSVLSDLGRAAGDVLMETGAKLKAAAQKAGVDTDELKGAFQDAGSAVAHAGGAVVDYVKQEAPGKLETVREGAKDAISRIKDSVSIHVDFDEDFVDDDYQDDFQDEIDAAQAEADEAQAEADAARIDADLAQAEADEAQGYADALREEAGAQNVVEFPIVGEDEDEEDL